MRQNLGGVIGELSTLPGCTQIAVSHGVFVPPENRGKGLGTWANTERTRVAHDLGYDYILCTVDSANVAQCKVMQKNGWVVLSTFKSRKTSHWVLLYGRSLR